MRGRLWQIQQQVLVKPSTQTRIHAGRAAGLPKHRADTYKKTQTECSNPCLHLFGSPNHTSRSPPEKIIEQLCLSAFSIRYFFFFLPPDFLPPEDLEAEDFFDDPALDFLAEDLPPPFLDFWTCDDPPPPPPLLGGATGG
ncbi:MAG: hypothetical protein ACKOLA_16025 [Spartobacteria bacterium]